ncbi:Hypothetical predicted protein, partial [Marmota monax]
WRGVLVKKQTRRGDQQNLTPHASPRGCGPLPGLSNRLPLLSSASWIPEAVIRLWVEDTNSSQKSFPCADLTSVDPVRGKTALEWALLTDSFDTVQRIRQLLQRPRVEQLSQHYQLEWPALPGLVAQAQAQAQVAPSFLERLQSTLSFSFAQSPQEGGVLDHLVTITTGLASPFLATACHTLCPDYPPALGTRSKSVPELLGTAPPPPPVPQPPQEVPGPRVFVPYQSPQGMFSQWLQPRSSTSTRSQVPKILLSKAPSAPRQYKFMSKSSGHNNLVLPLWRYQELRLERKRQEEARLAQDQGKMG